MRITVEDELATLAQAVHSEGLRQPGQPLTDFEHGALWALAIVTGANIRTVMQAYLRLLPFSSGQPASPPPSPPAPPLPVGPPQPVQAVPAPFQRPVPTPADTSAGWYGADVGLAVGPIVKEAIEPTEVEDLSQPPAPPDPSSLRSTYEAALEAAGPDSVLLAIPPDELAEIDAEMHAARAGNIASARLDNSAPGGPSPA